MHRSILFQYNDPLYFYSVRRCSIYQHSCWICICNHSRLFRSFCIFYFVSRLWFVMDQWVLHSVSWNENPFPDPPHPTYILHQLITCGTLPFSPSLDEMTSLRLYGRIFVREPGLMKQSGGNVENPACNFQFGCIVVSCIRRSRLRKLSDQSCLENPVCACTATVKNTGEKLVGTSFWRRQWI